jgi:hypothetical protein
VKCEGRGFWSYVLILNLDILRSSPPSNIAERFRFGIRSQKLASRHSLSEIPLLQPNSRLLVAGEPERPSRQVFYPLQTMPAGLVQ